MAKKNDTVSLETRRSLREKTESVAGGNKPTIKLHIFNNTRGISLYRILHSAIFYS